MSFDFKKYILNEALTSSVVREIINEPSGFFKYQQANNSLNNSRRFSNDANVEKRLKLKKIYEQVKNFTLTGLKYTIHDHINYDPEKDDTNEVKTYGPFEISEKDPLSKWSVQKLVKINEQYKRLCQQVTSKTKNLGKRPQASLFEIIINSAFKNTSNRIIDLATITDRYFTKLNVKEFEQWCVGKLGKSGNDIPAGRVYFFFNSDGEYLCAATYENIISVNHFANVTWPKQDARTIYDNLPGKDFKEITHAFAKQLTDGDALFRVIIKTICPDGQTILEWPIIRQHFYYYNNIGVGLANTSCTLLNYSSNIRSHRSYYEHTYKPGRAWKSTSNLAQISGWNKSKENYVYVFDFDKYQQSNEGYRTKEDVQNPSNPELIANSLNAQHKDRNKAKQGMVQKYEWAYDNLMNVQPYVSIYTDQWYSKNKYNGQIIYLTTYDPETQKFVNQAYSYNDAYKQISVYNGGQHVMWCSNIDLYNSTIRKDKLALYKSMQVFIQANREIKQLCQKLENNKTKLVSIMAEHKALNKEIKKIIMDPECTAAEKEDILAYVYPGKAYMNTLSLIGCVSRATQSVVAADAALVELQKYLKDVDADGHVQRYFNDMKDTLNESDEIFNLVDESIQAIKDKIDRYYKEKQS